MSQLSEVLDGLRARMAPVLLPSLAQMGSSGGRVQIKDEQRLKQTMHLRANALRVSPEITPRIETAALKVAEAIQCPRNLFEIFVFPTSAINGFCLIDHLPVTIGISSEAVRVLDDQELCFLLGHELGHACFREISDEVASDHSIEDAQRSRFIELTVDRVGLLASRDLEASCRAIIKLISGLGQSDIRFDFARFAQDARELERGDVEQADLLASHPPLPIRFRALLAFAQSDLFAGFVAEGAGGVTLDSVNRSVARAMDRAVDRRADGIVGEALTSAVEWIATFAIVHQKRVSLKAVAEATGVALRRDTVERSVEFIMGFSPSEQRALISQKTSEAITEVLRIAPRRAVLVFSKVATAFPGLDVELQLPRSAE